jgi:hypothetical protein
MQKKDHSEKSLRARQRGMWRMRGQSKALLALGAGDIIVVRPFGNVAGGLMAVRAARDAGTTTRSK